MTLEADIVENITEEATVRIADAVGVSGGPMKDAIRRLVAEAVDKAYNKGSHDSDMGWLSVD